MENKEFETLINGIKGKLGDENSALIADDLGTLITDNSNMNNDISSRDNQITQLKQEKENLITANGNLLKQVAMGTDPFDKPREEKEKSRFNMKDAFDEKGNFK